MLMLYLITPSETKCWWGEPQMNNRVHPWDSLCRVTANEKKIPNGRVLYIWRSVGNINSKRRSLQPRPWLVLYYACQLVNFVVNYKVSISKWPNSCNTLSIGRFRFQVATFIRTQRALSALMFLLTKHLQHHAGWYTPLTRVVQVHG